MKNHLSTRPRTEIHLCRPEVEPRLTGVLEVGYVDAAAENSDSAQCPLIPAAPGGPETTPVVTASGLSLAVASAQSKSAKA